MYFGMKSYLKSNRYHTAKHTQFKSFRIQVGIDFVAVGVGNKTNIRV